MIIREENMNNDSIRLEIINNKMHFTVNGKPECEDFAVHKSNYCDFLFDSLVELLYEQYRLRKELEEIEFDD